jgi:bacteriocin-like protein
MKKKISLDVLENVLTQNEMKKISGGSDSNAGGWCDSFKSCTKPSDCSYGKVCSICGNGKVCY